MIRKKPKKYNTNFYNHISKKLMNIQKLGSGTITFLYYDGSVLSTPFSMQLFYNKFGKQISFGEVITNLNDLKHDYRAKSWEIN